MFHPPMSAQKKACLKNLKLANEASRVKSVAKKLIALSDNAGALEKKIKEISRTMGDTIEGVAKELVFKYMEKQIKKTQTKLFVEGMFDVFHDAGGSARMLKLITVPYKFKRDQQGLEYKEEKKRADKLFIEMTKLLTNLYKIDKDSSTPSPSAGVVVNIHGLNPEQTTVNVGPSTQPETVKEDGEDEDAKEDKLLIGNDKEEGDSAE